MVVRKLKSKKNGELLKTVVEHQDPDGECTIYTYPAGLEVPPISHSQGNYKILNKFFIQFTLTQPDWKFLLSHILKVIIK